MDLIPDLVVGRVIRVKNLYILLGCGLLFNGVWLAPLAQFLLKSTPLCALGLSMVVLGAVCIVLGRTRPGISPEVSAILLQTSVENISALIEELGLRSKAVYLPSSKSGRPQALIPLRSNPALPVVDSGALPKRLIVKYGPRPDDVGLLVSTPGSATAQMLEARPGPTSAELEDAILSVVDGILDAASGVRVAMADKSITVEMTNPRIEHRSTLFSECLGSPLASIAAALAAEALGKPVYVEAEEHGKGRSVFSLGILG